MSRPATIAAGVFKAECLAILDRVARERAISVWELGMLADTKHVVLDRPADDWVTQALGAPRVELLPLRPAIALRAATLGALHGDPADRLILATALVHDARLVTRDAKLTDSGLVNVVW